MLCRQRKPTWQAHNRRPRSRPLTLKNRSQLSVCKFICSCVNQPIHGLHDTCFVDSGSPQREPTAGDHNGRTQRETTAGHRFCDPGLMDWPNWSQQREPTVGEHIRSPNRDPTSERSQRGPRAGDHNARPQRESTAGDHNGIPQSRPPISRSDTRVSDYVISSN